MQEQTKSYSFWQNVRYIFDRIGSKRVGLTLQLTVYALSRGVQVLLGAVTVKWIMRILLQSATQTEVLHTVLALGIGAFLAGAAEDISWNLYWPNVVSIRFQFLSLLGRKAMMLDYPATENVEQLQKLELARAASSTNKRGFAGLLVNLSKIASAAASIAMCLAVMGQIAPLTILPILLCAAVNHQLLKQYKKQEFETNYEISEDIDQKKEVFDTVFWNFRFGKEIRIFDFSMILLDHFFRILHRQEGLFEAIQAAKFHNTFLVRLSTLVCETIAYAVVLHRVTGGALSAADFLTIIGVFDSILLYTEDCLTLAADLGNNSREINSFRAFVEAEQQSEQTGRVHAPQSFRSLTFEHVTFRYPGTNKLALLDVSFAVQTGQRVALVGFNGSGKTTILKLIMRLYTPTEGRILLNGQDIQSYDLLEYYALFSTMFQDVQVYAFSMAENIAMSPTVDSDRLRAAIDLSGLRPVVDKFPAHEQTQLLKLVEDSGVELSGGEAQKLAFARAIYKNGSIVLLDEPTAALDAFSESRMFEAIRSFTADRTSIVVTHRLSSVRQYDTILYLEMGQLKEVGTHTELLAQNGAYAALFHQQADLYEKAAQAQTTEEVSRV